MVRPTSWYWGSKDFSLIIKKPICEKPNYAIVMKCFLSKQVFKFLYFLILPQGCKWVEEEKKSSVRIVHFLYINIKSQKDAL